MRFTKALIQALISNKSGLLEKKTLGREHYNGRLILRLHVRGRRPGKSDVWYMLGYGNLRTGLFYGLMLEPSPTITFAERERDWPTCGVAAFALVGRVRVSRVHPGLRR